MWNTKFNLRECVFLMFQVNIISLCNMCRCESRDYNNLLVYALCLYSPLYVYNNLSLTNVKGAGWLAGFLTGWLAVCMAGCIWKTLMNLLLVFIFYPFKCIFTLVFFHHFMNTQIFVCSLQSKQYKEEEHTY